MTLATNFGMVAAYELTGDLNGLGSSGTLVIGSVPADFRPVFAEVELAAGTTNNEVDIGDATTADGIFDGLDNSAGAVSANWRDATAGAYETNYKYAAETEVVVTNVGAAAIPSVATAVTLRLYGFRDYR